MIYLPPWSRPGVKKLRQWLEPIQSGPAIGMAEWVEYIPAGSKEPIVMMKWVKWLRQVGDNRMQKVVLYSQEDKEFVEWVKQRLEAADLEVITLSEEEFDKFAKILENPPPLSEKLRALIEGYKMTEQKEI